MRRRARPSYLTDYGRYWALGCALALGAVSLIARLLT